jgi:putative endonuclease
MLTKQYYVYILFNQKNGTLYIGVTNDLQKRTWEHKNKVADGFTKKYGIDKLAYYEVYDDIEYAIKREKQLKAGSRQKKIDLINSINNEWIDLYDKL